MFLFNKNTYQNINVSEEDNKTSPIAQAAHYLESLSGFDYVRKFTRCMSISFSSSKEAKQFKKTLASKNLITIESRGSTVEMTYDQWDQLATYWNQYKDASLPELLTSKELPLNLWSSLRSHRPCCVLM